MSARWPQRWYDAAADPAGPIQLYGGIPVAPTGPVTYYATKTKGELRRLRNPYLCLVIVTSLGLCCVLGVFGIVFLAHAGKVPPDSLVAIVSGAVGSLSSFLATPPRGSVGVDDKPQETKP